MQQDTRRVGWVSLGGLFFLVGMALGAWFVPLGTVLDAHGLEAIKPLAFATAATASMISPLLFGAMADRQVAPARVLRWLAVAGALTLAGVAIAIQRGRGAWVVLGLIQCYMLFVAPGWGLSSSIVLAQLTDPARQFGPVRALGTLGWMAGCWLVSGLHADRSVTACLATAGVWLAVAAWTSLFPNLPPAQPGPGLGLRERLGLDALRLLKERDHRVVFLTTALFAIPLAAFYPFTPTHLRQLGLDRTSAWMTLGQVSEIAAMLALPGLLASRRLKWTLLGGLAFGVVRYALCALDGKGWVLAGVSLHGFAFTLSFITAQIYLDQRVDPAWRARAQALFSLMQSGFGNLLGYLGTGRWFQACQTEEGVAWPKFWGGLALASAVVLIYFVSAYRGRKSSA